MMRLATITMVTFTHNCPAGVVSGPRRAWVRQMSVGAREDDALVRLDKLLAERGAGSRKDVDRMIRRGLVEVDGEIVPKAGAKLKVPYSTSPVVDGFEYPAPPLLAAYHKPLGVVSSMRDERGRPDLSAVLPATWQSSLHPVGRLDADTTGLLLFSRDGDLTHRLLHPKYVVEREYLAEVEGAIDAADLGARLAAGIETIEDGASLIVPAQLLDVTEQTVRLTVTEGKHRMVRRVLANAGHPVIELHRVRYGEVRLDELDLAEGEAAAIEGEALAWATSLMAASSKESVSRAVRVDGAGEASRAGQADADVEERNGATYRSARERPAGPVEPALAMEAAWMPRARDVALVMEEAEVSRAEAVDALKRHKGDIVAALQELL